VNKLALKAVGKAVLFTVGAYGLGLMLTVLIELLPKPWPVCIFGTGCVAIVLSASRTVNNSTVRRERIREIERAMKGMPRYAEKDSPCSKETRWYRYNEL
jgi:hypothetical protein